MAREFDRFMIDIELSSNPKIARFDDREFRCILTGVWALAAKAKPRGYLLVGKSPATAADIAHQARCSVAVAERTLAKMRELDMIECEDEAGWEHVHDWERINPAPKVDPTAAERQRSRRARLAGSGPGHDPGNGSRHGVTERDSHGEGHGNGHAGHANVTPTEVEGEGEVQKNVNTSSSARADIAECFAYWQERCGHPAAKLTADREARVRARLREGYTVQQIRQAIDGAARAAYVDDAGKRFDDLELICRKGSKLEDFMGRAVAKGNVVALQRPVALQRADAWLAHYPEEAS